MQEGPRQVDRRRHQADPLGPRLDPARQSRHKRQPIKAKEKKGLPFGMLGMGLVGGLFCAYAFNANGIKDSLDTWFEGLTTNVHTHDAVVSGGFLAALPVLGALVVLAVVYGLVKMALGGKKKPRPKPLQEQMTVHAFAELLAGRGVGARVAREAYRMLMADYAETLRSTLDKSFVELEVSRESVVGMFEELVERTEGLHRGMVPVLRTVMEMLIAVEVCVERAALERRRSMQGVVVEERHRLVMPVRES